LDKTDEKQPQGEQPDFYTNKFIGNFEIRRILNESDSKEQEMYHVTFKDGGMTKIHTHESEQILIATTSSSENSNYSDVGRGFVVIIEKAGNGARDKYPKFHISKTIFLDKIGDTVCIPPNVQGMKKVMDIVDDKVPSILSDIHNEIKAAISG
jgi:hypothetical protein